MLAITNSAFDLLVLQLGLHTVLLRLLLLAVFLPCDRRSKYDIFAHTRRVKRWTSGVAFLYAEFRPCPSLGDTRVDCFAHDGCADTPCGFYLFARVVKGVADGSFGAVFVGGYRRGGKGGGVIEFFVVSPIWAALGWRQRLTGFFGRGTRTLLI